MAKKLPIYDPATGLEMVEEHVIKMPTNHTELEGDEAFGLGIDSDLLLPLHKSTPASPPKLRRGSDKTISFFPPTPGGSELYFHSVDLNDENIDTFSYKKDEKIKYKNGQTNIRNSFYIFPCASSARMSQSDIRDKKSSWNNTPTPSFLYDKKGIQNREMTFYVKVGEPLKEQGSLQRVIVRLGGLYDSHPSQRSFIEIGYPTQDYPDVFMNIAYKANKNIFVNTINQYLSGDRIIPNKWIGIKIISMISKKDKSHIWYGVYVDLTPFDDEDNIPNNTWRLKADLIFTGVKEYNNIIPIWKCEYDAIIVDGYESVEFKNISDREVDFTGFKPLHYDLTTIAGADKPLFRKAMVPSWNPNDFELEQDVIIDNNDTITNNNASNTSSHTKLSIPRANRDYNPTDPSFYGRYT